MDRAMLIAAIALVATPAGAAVVEAGADFLEVSSTARIAAPPERIYDALIQPARWWDPAHTWSGDAANLTLDARAGGCFCETLPDGSVQHLTVVYADHGRMLRLRGALGPLQGMAAQGPLTWRIEPAAGGASVTQTYAVSGHVKGGADKLAPIVDQVLAGQLARLRRYVETGRPD